MSTYSSKPEKRGNGRHHCWCPPFLSGSDNTYSLPSRLRVVTPQDRRLGRVLELLELAVHDSVRQLTHRATVRSRLLAADQLALQVHAEHVRRSDRGVIALGGC